MFCRKTTASPTAAPPHAGRPRSRSPFSSLRFRALLEFGDQGYTMKAGRRQPTHHFHHGAIVHFLVPADIDPGFGAAARLRHRLHLGDQIVYGNLGILQENLALVVDRQGERFLVLIEALGLALRQIDWNPDREQWRRHHEDDEEDEHHVHHRRNVDLAHHPLAMMLALSDHRRAGIGSHKMIPYPRSSICRDRMAANSSAKPSSRCACLLTSAANLL